MKPVFYPRDTRLDFPTDIAIKNRVSDLASALRAEFPGLDTEKAVVIADHFVGVMRDIERLKRELGVNGERVLH